MAKIDAEKFTEGLRALDPSLARAKVSRIDVDRGRRSVFFHVISDRAVTEQTEKAVLEYVNESVPDSFRGVYAKVEKIALDAELVEEFVFRYIRDNFRSVAHAVERGDVSATVSEEVGKYRIRAVPAAEKYFVKNRTIEEISEELGRNFCGAFTGEIEQKESDFDAAGVLAEYREQAGNVEEVRYRTVRVTDVIEIDDPEKKDLAVYIADVESPVDEITLAGTVTAVREKQTKTGKPFFIFDFTDGTGTASGMYFTRQKTVDKIREIREGDAVVVTASAEMYNDSLSFRLRKINRCTFPADFVPEEKEGKRPEAFYSLVFPSPVAEIRQADLFAGEDRPPECMTGRTFVVVDLETTGKNFMSDTVTEIGAVKIENGKITEKFETLVNPEQEICEFITNLTGITNEMVADAPTYGRVAADFYKFTYGSTIVAHNVEFDYKFIKHLGRKEGYLYDNPSVDTVQFARDMLNLSNYKLNTVAEYFHFEFTHHRAWSDALVTAQIFIELVKMKKSIPNR